MATAVQHVPAMVTLDEYLHTVYHPDCDFVDGHLEERSMGETPHGLLQVELGFWFRLHRDEWKIRAITELRTRVSSTRVRIPDVMVVSDDEAIREPVRMTPPLLCIEILSPEDRLPRVIVRLNDYLDMGVAHVWLIDPIERAAFIYTRDGLRLVDGPRMTIAESPIYLDLPELFAALD